MKAKTTIFKVIKNNIPKDERQSARDRVFADSTRRRYAQIDRIEKRRAERFKQGLYGPEKIKILLKRGFLVKNAKGLINLNSK